MNKHKGYTFLELTIVLTIIGLGLIVVVTNVGISIVSAKIENVVIDMANAVITAQNNARAGNNNKDDRTFNLKKADIKPHSGVTVTTDPPTTPAKNCLPCAVDKASLCVSGQSFCHSTNSIFTFDKFSGELDKHQVIFALSKNRRLALLITQRGGISIAEFINGEWRSRTDLQNLLPKQKSDTQLPEKF